MLNSIQRAAKDAATEYFFQPTASAEAMGEKTASENVIGWGIGINASGEDAVIVHVQEKFSGFKIPDEFGELPTDTVEVGQVTAYQDPTERHRPTRSGVSVGHPNITSGTLGCLVEKDGNHYILSNNHILAATNTAGEDDPVVQPGPQYGGSSPEDNIAMLEDYKRIDFTAGIPDNPNKIDAAIAKVGDRHQKIVLQEIIGVGMPRSTPFPSEIDLRGRSVEKYGARTQHTIGVVRVTDFLVRVRYKVGDQKLVAVFDDQIVISRDDSEPFSKGGDSGSLIVDSETRKPVALLFAGGEDEGEKMTYANPINLVLTHYKVTIVGK